MSKHSKRYRKMKSGLVSAALVLALTITAGYAAFEGHEGAGPARLDPKGLATPTVQRTEGPRAPDPGNAPKTAPETRDAPSGVGSVRLAFAGGGT